MNMEMVATKDLPGDFHALLTNAIEDSVIRAFADENILDVSAGPERPAEGRGQAIKKAEGKIEAQQVKQRQEPARIIHVEQADVLIETVERVLGPG